MERKLGCDIHLYVERRINGIWESVDKWTPNKYADENGGPGETVDYDDEFYMGRNYNLFAILADVRNGRGFAGCDTGDKLTPISSPRGIPDDVDPRVRAACDSWGGDGHRHSWHTLADLLSYDWTQVAVHRGWVDPVNWAQWRDNGKPREWSGGISGPTVRHLSPADFEGAWVRLRFARNYPEERRACGHLRIIHGGNEDLHEFVLALGGGTPVCQVQWSTPYYDSAKDFWSTTIPRLLRLGPPEDVRIVFWFDN